MAPFLFVERLLVVVSYKAAYKTTNLSGRTCVHRFTELHEFIPIFFVDTNNKLTVFALVFWVFLLFFGH